LRALWEAPLWFSLFVEGLFLSGLLMVYLAIPWGM